MKSFIISICALALVFAMIICNFFYILNIYKYMSTTVSELSINSNNDANELWEYWNKKSVFIALSVPHKISDELEKNLIILKTKIKESSEVEFEETKQLLLNSIEEMRIHAGISADSIF